MKKLLLFVFVLGFIGCSDDPDGSNPDTNQSIDSQINPGIGIGDLTFSSTGNDVLDIYGDVEDLTVVNSTFVLWYYDLGLGIQLEKSELDGLSLQEKFDMRFELVDYSKSIITMVVLPPYSGETADGIKLGSTKADVISIYGEPDDVSSFAEDYDQFNMRVGYNASDLVDRIDLLE